MIHIYFRNGERIQEGLPALLADIDQNTSIDAQDALQILKTVVKLIPPVPYRQGGSEEPPGESEEPAEGKTLVVYFTGKTVIPFCTSASSGIGESGTILKELAGTGNWLEGMRFRSNASEETVQEWVRSLAVR